MSSVNNDPQICAICLETCSEDGKVQFKGYLSVNDCEIISKKNQTTIELKCAHIFHANCLHQWIEIYKIKTSIVPCPSCRSELMAKPFVTLNNTPLFGEFANAFLNDFNNAEIVQRRNQRILSLLGIVADFVNQAIAMPPVPHHRDEAIVDLRNQATFMLQVLPPHASHRRIALIDIDESHDTLNPRQGYFNSTHDNDDPPSLQSQQSTPLFQRTIQEVAAVLNHYFAENATD